MSMQSVDPGVRKYITLYNSYQTCVMAASTENVSVRSFSILKGSLLKTTRSVTITVYRLILAVPKFGIKSRVLKWRGHILAHSY